MEIKKISELPVATTLDSTVIVLEDALVGKQFDGGLLARRDANNVFSGTNEFNGTTQLDGSLTGTVGAEVALKNVANTFTADQTMKQDGAANDFIMESSTNAQGKNIIRMRNARGSDASKSHNTSGDILFSVFADTFDGTSSFAECGRMRIVASENHSATARGTKTTLWNTPDTTTTPAIALEIPSVGVYSNTTATAANMVITSGNVMQRSTSSKKFKTDIEDMDMASAEKVVDLVRPIWYRSKCKNDDKTWSWWGIIAEELAEIDPRLVSWGYWPEDYQEKDGEMVLKKSAKLSPVGVQYDRIAVLMLKVMQKDRKRINDIEARLSKLEGKK